MTQETSKIIESIKEEFDEFILSTKDSLNQTKRIAADQAWKILQLAIALVIQLIEKTAKSLNGPDKKNIAMSMLSNFYDKVFVVVDIPIIPNILEPVIHKYVKTFLMILVGSSIDAMVITFREVGVFENKDITQQTIVTKKKIKSNRKRK